ncbi:MAG: RcnB family protein [Candidatus Andeanibacterium colombiense]|uniref:RcnB family protein n=1 Tax=Candidatus Andeanibacterium colombiense TaxID=3121345 RepID=A0AAJ6BPT2_9SPHN|nr:MAG: RcnB family protein [Sphingomonadaceae bacterium]
MRKILTAAIAATLLVPAVGYAQSAGEVRHDKREVAKDQREVKRDLARGKFREAREDARETREDRKELREDWRDYRNKNRNAFHRSAYSAPRGMMYRPVAVGARLHRAFYGKPYWVSNYSAYRLPRPGAGLTYVRYGNDVLLINSRTGRVIRVYDKFFW